MRSESRVLVAEQTVSQSHNYDIICYKFFLKKSFIFDNDLSIMNSHFFLFSVVIIL